jgi:uridine phosphorylase
MSIQASELILNQDGSIYHLNLKPENIGDLIITVGDQDRVEKITMYFDSIIFETQKREFKTITGTYKGKKISVISTGIGVDNIDIVINELDAIVNIDLETRTPKATHRKLTFVRMGTSGSIQPSIPVDSFVVSTSGLGFDGLIHFYAHNKVVNEGATTAVTNFLSLSSKIAEPYIIDADELLVSHFKSLNNPRIHFGYTGTNIGFYGPQGRVLRLPLAEKDMMDKLVDFSYEGHRVTNLEMETSAIYALAKMLGHSAISINAIIANRALGTFSEDPKQAVEDLISFALDEVIQFV